MAAWAPLFRKEHKEIKRICWDVTLRAAQLVVNLGLKKPLGSKNQSFSIQVGREGPTKV